MIKQIVLQTEWATNQRIYQMAASMEMGYPLRDGKQYTQADIDQARVDIKESEGKLNAALAEGYTLFASIPLKDSIGVNLILYKPDNLHTADNPDDRADKPWRTYLTEEEQAHVGKIPIHYAFKEQKLPLEGSVDALLLKLIRLLDGNKPWVASDFKLQG